MEMENQPRNHNVFYGWLLIVFALIIIGLAILFGAHEVGGALSLMAVLGLMLFEGIKLITDSNRNKLLHKRFDEVEKILKKLRE